MKYTKPPLTFEDQAAQLISRGLITDSTTLVNTLQNINYYRLSGYLYPFRQPDDTYKSGTTLELILERYEFDRRLRLIILDAIEYIENAVRTDLTYHFSHHYGAFDYTNSINFPHVTPTDHQAFLERIKQESDRSQEVFVKHFRNKYGDSHNYLPLWMVVEIMSMGSLLTFYRGVDKNIKRIVSNKYNMPYVVFHSWLRSLNGIRNMCAHHARIWNRVLGYPPMIPRKRKHPEWHEPINIQGDRIFTILTIIQYLLKYIAPGSKWKECLIDLLHDYPNIPQRSMGLPDNWLDCPIWDC